MKERVEIKCSFDRMVTIDQLTVLQGELKSLSKANYKKLRSQILKLGFCSPFHVWRDGDIAYLLDGTQRYRTLMQMRDEGIEVPGLPYVEVEAVDMNEAKRKLLSLTSQYGKIESDGLFEFISDSDISVDELKDSFSFAELSLDKFEREFFEPLKEGLTDADSVPEDAETRCKLGDLWLLGEHRLICGDSGDAALVKRLLINKPVLMATDPPYGVEYDPDWRNDAMNDKCSRQTGLVLNDDKTDWSSVYALWDAQVTYIWHPAKHTGEFFQSIKMAGYDIIVQIIWAKNNFAISRGDYHWKHEPCFYAVKQGSNHNWQGSRSETTVWDIEMGGAEKTGHGTQKPVECMLRPMLNNSKKGDIVCDPFLGSGTTVIAAEKSGRICYGMELDPKYCDTIISRWEQHTGKAALLAEG